jgi:hypothetical protein
VYGLARQTKIQRGDRNLLGERAAAQLRIQFPIDPQVQRNVQGAGLLGPSARRLRLRRWASNR